MFTPLLEPARLPVGRNAPDHENPVRVHRGWLIAWATAVVGALLISFMPHGIAGEPPEGFADLVDRVKPAVVNIASTQKIAAQDSQRGGQYEVPPGLRGTPFEEFLRRFFDQQRGGGWGDDGENPGPEPAVALGSGVLIDPSGYVVTNNHVIQNASKVQVTLSDGRKFDGRIIGRDDKTDLALLKVESKDALPYVSWGDSDKARVGDWVIAVGNPFGLGGTVTAGIISARGRDIQSGPFDDYLQIDAPINRGNSGGPSFDRRGEVIGINTAIYSPSGGSIGIGFAVPASLARPIITELRERGRIDRGWLGVSIQPVTKEIAESLNLGIDKGGALIAEVTPKSPAANADLRQGDVILTIDGTRVAQSRDVARMVASAGPDRTVVLGVWRDGKEISVRAALGRLPAERNAVSEERPASKAAPAAVPAAVLGLSLLSITREVRQRFDLPDDAKGALVVNVKPDSPAGEAGLMPGDVIVKVGEKKIAAPLDVEEAVRAANKAGRKAVLILAERKGVQRFVGVTLQES